MKYVVRRLILRRASAFSKTVDSFSLAILDAKTNGIHNKQRKIPQKKTNKSKKTGYKNRSLETKSEK